jgi:hypothetical protein
LKTPIAATSDSLFVNSGTCESPESEETHGGYTANVANSGEAGHRNANRATGFDLARAVALATALEPFAASEVRPLARELVELLKAAQPAGVVVSIFERRPK